MDNLIFAMAPFECPLCDKSYLVKQSLRYHIRTSHQGQPKKSRRKHDKSTDLYPCPHQDCHFSYNTETRLQNHLVLKHSAKPVDKKPSKWVLGKKNETLYPCPYPDCLNGYSTEKRLEGHLALCHPLHEQIPMYPSTEYHVPEWPIFMSQDIIDL